MILINKTYQIITEQSAENGEASEHGFVYENVPYSFRELVEALEIFYQSSCMPAAGNVYEWLSSEADIDPHTGEEYQESIHYSRDNPAKNDKYWRKAMMAAGIIQSK